jgi:hypothetical protein
MRGAVAVLAAFACGACSHGGTRVSSTPLPLVTGNYPQYGHASNFSWVAGRVALRPNGCAYVVFDTHHSSPYDGRVALFAQQQTLEQLHDGDMVVALGAFNHAPAGECGPAALDISSIGEH